MASTDDVSDLPALVRDAARGELPDWAVAGEKRRRHMARVAGLLEEWAAALDLSPADRIRWTAAGWLHDVLRDAEHESLRDLVPADLRDLPGGLLHGPAAAERLRDLDDPALLNAIRYHTIGHPDLDRLGRAVYLADYLDPARKFEPEWRASLRDAMPHEMDEVVTSVAAQRIGHLIESRNAIRPETAAFWSSLVERGE